MLAGAALGKVLMWDVNDRDVSPRSSWHSAVIEGHSGNLVVANGTSSETTNGENAFEMAIPPLDEEKEQPHQNLTWNADGTRLAYAVHHQVCV